tara:strand:- start:145 stop:552 length:408 start_codon:yes stop_codon:yes gene_type:complete
MNKKIKHITILILFAVGVVFSIKYYFAENEQNLVFTTDFVKKGNIEDVVLTNGVLYPYTLVDVGSQASGQIDNIAVNSGDQVKKGDLIAQIDNLTQKNTLKEAQASLIGSFHIMFQGLPVGLGTTVQFVQVITQR